MPSNIAIAKEDIVFPYQESGYAHQCFPVRNIRRFKPDNGGAWLVEYKTEKQHQLQRLNRTDNDNEKRKKTQKTKRVKELTGFLLTKEFHLNDPSDLFSININGKQLHSAKDEDFSLFSNVLCIEAGDNHLAFETFKTFSYLEELQLQLNHISTICITHKEFQHLKKLDLSYNHLNKDALLDLGKLRNIKELTLRGCSLTNLPPELSRGYLISVGDIEEKERKAEKKRRFPELEYLDLAENNLTDLSTFASLAGLRKLKNLNLSSNKICGIPHLRLLVANQRMSASTCVCRSPLDADHINNTDGIISKQESIKLDAIEKAKLININENSVIDQKAEKECTQRIFPNTLITDDIVVDEDDLAELNFLVVDDNSNINPLVNSSVSNFNFDHNVSDEKDDDNDMISKMGDMFKIKKIDIEAAMEEIGESVDRYESYNTPKSLKKIDIEPTMKEIGENGVRHESSNTPQSFIGEDCESKGMADNNDILSNNDNLDDLQLDNATLYREINFALKDFDNQNDAPFAFDENNFSSKAAGDGVPNEHIKDPFSQLVILDLSYNLIADEETLLALTSWPMLQDLKLWGNPLMHVFKGTPPIIAHHLENQCGITVHKKEPQANHVSHSIGPSIAKSTKTYRVKTRLPPIKRNNLLMIEDAIQKAVADSENKDEDPPVVGIEESKLDSEDIPCEDYKEGIFMTQLNEEGHEEEKQIRREEESKSVQSWDDKYSDYEELLKIDETYGPESEIPIPSTVYGSVQALRQMLKNPLIFKEGSYNKKSRLASSGKHKSKSASMVKKRKDEVGDALDYIRTRETTYEENLASVLDQYGDNEMKNKFPDVKKIVKRVQDKYDKVRLESLRPISVAQAELSRLSTRADKHSQDLILMRMKQGRIGDMYSSSRSTGSPRMRNSTVHS